jgi:hypothetical protein
MAKFGQLPIAPEACEQGWRAASPRMNIARRPGALLDEVKFGKCLANYRAASRRSNKKIFCSISCLTPHAPRRAWAWMTHGRAFSRRQFHGVVIAENESQALLFL